MRLSNSDKIFDMSFSVELFMCTSVPDRYKKKSIKFSSGSCAGTRTKYLRLLPVIIHLSQIEGTSRALVLLIASVSIHFTNFDINFFEDAFSGEQVSSKRSTENREGIKNVRKSMYEKRFSVEN